MFINAMAIYSCNGDIFAVFGGDSDAVDISWKRSDSAGGEALDDLTFLYFH